MAKRLNISSGAPPEERMGYSRAVRVGDTVHVAGTTSIDADGDIQAKGDMYGQCVIALDKIERALEQAGATMADVVRTRTFVTDMSLAEGFSRAHKERFDAVRPASSLIGTTALAHPDMLVEIEVDAIAGAGG